MLDLSSHHIANFIAISLYLTRAFFEYFKLKEEIKAVRVRYEFSHRRGKISSKLMKTLSTYKKFMLSVCIVHHASIRVVVVSLERNHFNVIVYRKVRLR